MIVALTIVVHWAGHDILDLCSSLVDILLPIGVVLHLSLLPSTILLHWLHILLWLEFALVVISSWLVVVQELVFPFGDEGLVHQSQEVWEIKHAESAPEMLIQASKKPVDLPLFCGHIMERIAGPDG